MEEAIKVSESIYALNQQKEPYFIGAKHPYTRYVIVRRRTPKAEREIIEQDQAPNISDFVDSDQWEPL